MRTLGFRSCVLIAVAAAAGLVAALGRPWYGPPAPAPAADARVGTLPSTIDQFFSGLSRSLSAPDGSSAWTAFETADLLMLALAAIGALLALATLVPALQAGATSGTQFAALSALGIVAFKLVDQPGGRAAVEARSGGWLALLCAVVMVFCAMHLAAAPRRRRRAPASYRAPAAPTWEPPDSVAPPPRECQHEHA